MLLGDTKLESTVRYLGIKVEDGLEMAEQTEFDWCPPWLFEGAQVWPIHPDAGKLTVTKIRNCLIEDCRACVYPVVTGRMGWNIREGAG